LFFSAVNIFQFLVIEALDSDPYQKNTDPRLWIISQFIAGMMSVQFGVLARLTCWEYSWDIMEQK
jgi:hypothetical protein